MVTHLLFFPTLLSEFAGTCQKVCLTFSNKLPATAVVTSLGVLAMALSFGSSVVTRFYSFLFLNVKRKIAFIDISSPLFADLTFDSYVLSCKDNSFLISYPAA